MPDDMPNLDILRESARHRRQAADAALTVWLQQMRGQRDAWLLVYAQRDIAIAEGLEQLIVSLTAQGGGLSDA